MSRHLPRLGVEWGSCSTCGRGFPITHLILSRRFGWQCLPGLWGNGCYDGPIQRDEIQYIPRPGEGSRRSASPTYTLMYSQGFTAGDVEAFEVRFRDQTTGTIWAFGSGDFAISGDQTSAAHGGWIFQSNYRLWVQDGFMYLGAPWPEVYKYIPAPNDISDYEFEVTESIVI